MRILIDGVYFGDTEGTLQQYLSMLNELTPGKYSLSQLSVEQNAALVVSNSTQVDAERDRRINAGFMFNGKLIQSGVTDRENVAGASQLAFMASLNGAEAGNLRWANPDEDYIWIAADNTLIPMDAPMVVDMGRTLAGFKQAMVFKARALKNLPLLPVDYTADKWWI